MKKNVFIFKYSLKDTFENVTPRMVFKYINNVYDKSKHLNHTVNVLTELTVSMNRSKYLVPMYHIELLETCYGGILEGVNSQKPFVDVVSDFYIKETKESPERFVKPLSREIRFNQNKLYFIHDYLDEISNGEEIKLLSELNGVDIHIIEFVNNLDAVDYEYDIPESVTLDHIFLCPKKLKQSVFNEVMLLVHQYRD